MPARLFSQVGETRGARFEIAEDAAIGRHPDNEIVLEPTLISSRHARIFYDRDEGGYVLEDLDSLNGTALDGQPVSGRERLRHLHVITFAGKHDFIYLDPKAYAARHGAPGAAPEAAARPAAAAPTMEPSIPGEDRPSLERTALEQLPPGLPGGLVQPTMEAVDGESTNERTAAESFPVALPDLLAGAAKEAGVEQPPRIPETMELQPDADLGRTEKTLLEKSGWAIPEQLEGKTDLGPSAVFSLEILNPGGRIERARLSDGKNVLGRGTDADIKPETVDISRRHAVLTVAGGKVTVRDLGSRNFTFLGDEKIEAETEIEIRAGTQLRFGSLQARLIVETEE